MALVLVVAIIAYASLRPFHGWQDRGLGLEVFFRWPHQRAALLDAMLNLVGYLPFGSCLALALFPKWQGRAAFAAGTILPGLFSLLVEILQMYLPGRYPSLIDVATNVIGATAGAAIAVLATPWLSDHRGGRSLRARFVAPGHLGEAGLFVLAAWLVAMFAQRTLLFGTGDFRGNMQVPVDWSTPRAVYFAVEAFAAAAHLGVAAAVLRLVLADDAPRWRWMLVLVGVALSLRLIAQLGFWDLAALWGWATPAALIGTAVGLAVAAGVLALSPRRAAWCGITLLLAGVLALNLTPPAPDWWLQPEPPRQQMLIGLALVARYTSKGWPLMALAFLLLAARQSAVARSPQ